MADRRGQRRRRPQRRPAPGGRPAAVQPDRPAHRGGVRRVRRDHRTAHHGLQPLGRGLLTGRHRFDAAPADGRFGGSRLAAMYKERYWDEQLFAAIAELTRIAEEAGMGLVELAFRWLVSRPATGSVLLGGSRPQQLRANLEVLARGPLEDSVVEACDRVGAALRGPMPAYNR
nr:aldo/keto reductase [Kocuria flava]